MNAKRDSRRDAAGADALDDASCLLRLARGDADALRAIIARHDRLVRFAIFRLSRDRSLRDPQWLDGLASEVWSAFAHRVREARGDIASAKALLVSIAHNRTISALRSASRERRPIAEPDVAVDAMLIGGPDSDDPARWLSHLEDLAALRACRDALPPDDRRLMSALGLILDRKWEAAASALEMPESSLRSRWKRLLERLQECMGKKKGARFAPSRSERDS